MDTLDLHLQLSRSLNSPILALLQYIDLKNVSNKEAI